LKYIPAKSRLGNVGKALFGVPFMMLCGAPPAFGHAFGARYDLPLPLQFYLFGAGAAVALSFVIMAFAFRNGLTRRDPLWQDLRDIKGMSTL